MKFLTDPILKTSREITELSSRLLDGGISFLKTSLGSIPLFAGTKVCVAEESLDADETHYFLVPYRLAESGYAISTRRVLPEGIGPENDLPKRRVFHLPERVRPETMETLLREQLAKNQIKSEDVSSDLADRLDLIAREIDKKGSIVTGGLLVIGGAVAIANPLVGAAIAAKALLPGVGALISREGLKKLGSYLRDRKDVEIRTLAEKAAESEVSQLRPKICRNELLSDLEVALSIEREDHDPSFSTLDNHAEPAAMRVHSMTAFAILNVYGEILKGKSKMWETACLHPNDIEWIRSLESYVQID